MSGGYEPELHHLEYRGKKTFQCYLNFYKDDKAKLFLAFVLFVIKHSPVWVIPVVTANIINALELHNERTLHVLLMQFGIGAVVILQNVPVHIWFVRVLSSVTRKVEMNLRSSLCTRLQHLSIPYHTNAKLGTLQTKVLRDVENIEMLTRMLIESLPGVIVSFAVAITVTGLRAPLFILFYLATVPFAVLFCHLVHGKMQRYNNEFRLSVEAMSGKVIEMLRLISVTRAHNVEYDELDRVNSKLREVRSSGLRLDALNAIFNSINWVIFMLFNLISVFTAALLSYKGIIQVGMGDIFLLGSYFGAISGAVLQLMNMVPAMSKGLESVRSVGEVLECPDIEMNEGKPAMTGLRGEFDFESVSFRYENADADAVHRFSLQVKPGETIALVGPSGSGKSTLMQLLIGFIRPNTGRILVDGNDMNEIDLRSYRRFISVVSQESILFDGSIRENITYGAGEVTEEEILRAVKNANLGDFIASLPKGLETPVKENGARLSGGQKQRLAIARALLRNPQLLLLDEATSALDVESEALIQDALERLIEGRTTFIVAHRLSTIRNADRIVVLRHGEIAEIGTHAELMKNEGIYYRMNLLQNRDLPTGEAVKIGAELERG